MTNKWIEEQTFTNISYCDQKLTQTEFESCTFLNCDFSGTVFKYTNLEKADFRTAYNYGFDPEVNKIKQAKFSFPGIAGLLGKYHIDIE